MEADRNVKLVNLNKWGNQYIFRFNHLFKPFDNPKIRQALLYAFNQKDFLDGVIGDPRYYKVCKAMFMPGLIDVHVHLAYGNAKSEEDIDLYSPMEFRALRGMFFAQKIAAAGYTGICSPGDAVGVGGGLALLQGSDAAGGPDLPGLAGELEDPVDVLHAGPDRRPRPSRLWQCQERGGHRPL